MSAEALAPYFVFILLSLLAGVTGSVSSRKGISTWYQSIRKPSWTPPNLVFAPVWTVLYLLMGSAASLVYLHSDGGVRTALIGLFLVHLIVNASWSYVFFARRNPKGAFYVIIVLWIMVGLLSALFLQVNTLAGAFMLIYELWISYALTLNAGVMMLQTPRT